MNAVVKSIRPGTVVRIRLGTMQGCHQDMLVHSVSPDILVITGEDRAINGLARIYREERTRELGYTYTGIHAPHSQSTWVAVASLQLLVAEGMTSSAPWDAADPFCED